jgi:hypothetical protein
MTDQSSDSTIFNSTTPEGTPPSQEQVTQPTGDNVDPLADLLKTITDPDGRQKYDSVEKALESMPHAQTHIQTLEDENRSLKAEKEALGSQADKITQLEETIKQMAQNRSTSEEPSGNGLDEQAVADLIGNVLTQRETQSTIKANQEAVANALASKYGDKAEQMYNDKAKELGIPVAELNRLAGTSKQAVLAWFGDVKPTAPAPSTGSINTDGYRSTTKEKPANPLLMGNNNLMDAWEAAGNKS